MKNSGIILLALLLVGCGVLIPNRHDREGNRHGRWEIRWSNGKVQSVGKFKHGKEVGEWRYYSIVGKIEKKEIYEQKENLIHTTYFESGEKVLEGDAYLYETNQALNYIWQGVWHTYSNGKYKHSLMYLNGNVIDTLILKTKEISHE